MLHVGAALSGESQAKADQVDVEKDAEGPKPAGILLDKLLSIDTDSWDFQSQS